MPVPSPDQWREFAAGGAFGRKNFAKTNMVSEHWPKTSTPHNVGKDVGGNNYPKISKDPEKTVFVKSIKKQNEYETQ